MKRIIIILALAFMLASHITVLDTFLTAYNNPSKSVRVDINNYGEANIELIFLIISIFIIITSFIIILKDKEVNLKLK